jgi:hypothetical protein
LLQNIRHATPGPNKNEKARLAPCLVRIHSGPCRSAAGVAGARRARPSTAARCFTALSSGDARLFAGEFVRSSFLVRRASTLGRYCPLGLWIHCGESAWRLATGAARTARLRSPVVSIAAGSAAARAAAPGCPASLVHPLPLVVGLVSHYRSPCRDIRRLSRSRLPDVTRKWQMVGARSRLSRILMRKRQAAISGRGRTACPATKLWISSLLSRV